MKIVLPVSRTFPKRSRNGVLFVAIGALATVASHFPTKHEVLPHTFSPLFSFFFPPLNQDSPLTTNPKPFITREFLKRPGWIEGRARVEEADEIRTDASILPLAAAHPHRCLFDRCTLITDA